MASRLWNRGLGVSQTTPQTMERGSSTQFMCSKTGTNSSTEALLVALQSSGAANLAATIVGPITGGTGKLARINGMARMSTTANPQTAVNETQVDIEYWLPQ